MKEQDNQQSQVTTPRPTREGLEVGLYRISGMSCNHCKANVERAIRGVDGVEEVTVDLASGMATVTGEHDPATLIERVKSYGYEAEMKKS